MFQAPGTTAPKAVMLQTVIDDLENGKSFARATIPFTVNEGSKLHKASWLAFEFDGLCDERGLLLGQLKEPKEKTPF